MTGSKTTIGRLGWAACLAGALALAGACGSSSSELVADADNGNGNGNGNGDEDAGDSNGNGEVDADIPYGHSCDGTTQCSDGIDNDGDGYIDMDDPMCASCFDDNESSFETGIPGDNVGQDGFQDCFFDGDSGYGNDGCRVPDCCYDFTDDSCEMYDESGEMTEECAEGFSDQCLEVCGAGTPPGCDCIGCCTICAVCERDAEGNQVDPDCDPNDLPCVDLWRNADFSQFPDCDPSDPDNFNEENCPTCEKHDECAGPDCRDEPCVLCSGESEDDLPPECEGETDCPGGTACSSDADCADNQYCALGCCLDQID